VLVAIRILDTLRGITIIFGLAGPFLAGASYEALVDHTLLRKVQHRRCKPGGRSDDDADSFALSVALVGSFKRDSVVVDGRTLGETVLDVTRDRERAKSFLYFLAEDPISFEAQIGFPFVFYAGAYFYTLVDAMARMGENDTAHAIAFGLLFSVVVIVAILSSVLLGAPSPRILQSALGQHFAGRSSYGLASERRVEISRWPREEIAIDGGEPVKNKYEYCISERRESGYAVLACIIAGLLVGYPCGLAIVVAYTTPWRGFSCRSVTVLAYLASQEACILLWYVYSSLKVYVIGQEQGMKKSGPKDEEQGSKLSKSLRRASIRILSP
jgi:hypothetical protein